MLMSLNDLLDNQPKHFGLSSWNYLKKVEEKSTNLRNKLQASRWHLNVGLTELAVRKIIHIHVGSYGIGHEGGRR